MVGASNQTFALPPSTPAEVPYINLQAGSTQYARNNFQPGKREFKRTISAEENKPALEKILKDVWGHTKFRHPQWEVCDASLRGIDVVVVAPTGIGKSLCFQLPAIALNYGITLVVSPLIALMKDQVSSMREKGQRVAMVCEESTEQETKYAQAQLKHGHPQIRLLYTTPETLFGPKLSSEIAIAYRQKQLRRLVVDEAHVIEEWGMTFRPMYRHLGKFREEYPDVPITALTASATEEVRADIKNILGITNDKLAQWVQPFNRKNLYYEVIYRQPRMDGDAGTAIAAYILRYRVEAAQRNKVNGVSPKCVSGLVYARTVESCMNVAQTLRKAGIKAAAYYAAVPKDERDKTMKDWKEGDLECVVATIAFGMGVDHPHVRYVFHYDLPKSFEGFYQETGRAGRDGHMSRCVLYYSREDAAYFRGKLEKEAIPPKKSISDMDPQAARDHAKRRCINSFKYLQIGYAEKLLCRHVAICRYFGENIDENVVAEKTAYCDEMCDVCSNDSAVLRRQSLINDDIEPASQIVGSEPIPLLNDPRPPSAASRRIPHSLDILHGSDAPSSDSDSRPSSRASTRASTSSLSTSSRTLGRPDGLTSPTRVSPRTQLPPIKVPGLRKTVPGPSRLRDTATPDRSGKARSASIQPRTPFAPYPGNMSLHPRSVMRIRDSLASDEGGYAEPAAKPESAKKRKAQADAFEGVKPVNIKDEGPFGYYNQTPTNAKARDNKRFKTPFRSPLIKTPEKTRVGPILLSARKEELELLQAQLIKDASDGQLADRLWDHWGRLNDDQTRRTKRLKKVSKLLERDCVLSSPTEATYRENMSILRRTLKIIRVTAGIEIFEKGELSTQYKKDKEAEWLRAFDTKMKL